MKANEYLVLVTAVEEGVRAGVRRAYKHTIDDSQPPDDDQMSWIVDGVMSSICEWFHIENNYED